eukprot:403371574
MEKLRTHNDYYYFLLKLIKEEDKQNFMIALEKDKHFEEFIDDKMHLIEITAQKKLKEKIIELISKQKDHEKAFKRTKEQRRDVVNFKDCRPNTLKQKSDGTDNVNHESEKGFVKHLGNVNYIEKGSLKVNIVKTQKDEQEKNKDKYSLKTIGEIQGQNLKELQIQVRETYQTQKQTKDDILDKCNFLILFNLCVVKVLRDHLIQLAPFKQEQLQKNIQIQEQQMCEMKNRMTNLQELKQKVMLENKQLKDELNFQEKNQYESVQVYCDQFKQQAYGKVFEEKKLIDKNKKKQKEIEKYCTKQNNNTEQYTQELQVKLLNTKTRKEEMHQKSQGAKRAVNKLFIDMKDQLGFYAEAVDSLNIHLDQQDFESMRNILSQRPLSDYKLRDYKENLNLLIQEVQEGLDDTKNRQYRYKNGSLQTESQLPTTLATNSINTEIQTFREQNYKTSANNKQIKMNKLNFNSVGETASTQFSTSRQNRNQGEIVVNPKASNFYTQSVNTTEKKKKFGERDSSLRKSQFKPNEDLNVLNSKFEFNSGINSARYFSAQH